MRRSIFATDMTRTSIAIGIAVQLVLLGVATAPAYADDLDPEPGAATSVEGGPPVEVGPAVEIGPSDDPFLDDIVDMISDGSELAPRPN